MIIITMIISMKDDLFSSGYLLASVRSPPERLWAPHTPKPRQPAWPGISLRRDPVAACSRCSWSAESPRWATNSDGPGWMP